MSEPFGSLISRRLFRTYSSELARLETALGIDLSGDAHSERGIKRAFGMLKEIGRRNLTPAQQAMLHYFRANAWSSKHQMEGSSGPRK